ncbi:MAG TPA: penicillin-binding protein 1C [bacterium]|nr:penicillin-binding protein 1C [bacterium]
MRLKAKILMLVTALLAAAAAAAGIAAAWLVPLPQRLAAPGSPMVEYADGSPMCVFLSPDDKWRIHVGLDEVDPNYLRALIQFEDSRFYRHPGVDPVAVARAAAQNLYARRVVSGASTITMQLVRILEPRPRTLRSKIIETLRALQLELRFGKPQILEYYLEFAPYGKNLEGVEAASLSYFGHRCRELSPFETAYLLSVPQNPTLRYPSPGHAAYMPRVVAHLSDVLRADGVFSEEQARQAGSTAPPDALRPFPRDAMHAAYYLEARRDSGRVKSTLRRDAQAIVETVLRNYRAELDSMGIHNAAVVVIENQSGSVVAAAGNFDFWDAEHQGQVIGFAAPRSPGSAMKPFIYALAIDRGLALPDYMVADAPVYYSGYAPINFDRNFRGLVRLQDALSQSLNIPFVNLTRDIGMDSFLDFLREAGVSTLNNEPGHYGLGIAVGGMDITLTDLVNLYAMLGRDGVYQDAAWTRGRPPSPPLTLLTPGAAYLTRQALRLRDRPDFPGRRRMTLPGNIFWKTGTSAHFRDAWAIGGDGEFTAGVWLGNFDGASSNYLTGADRSGPVLFDVLEGMAAKGHNQSVDRPPPDLIPVKICAWSGYLAGRNCPHLKTALALRGHLPPMKCPYHVEYLVDKDSGLRANPLCGKDLELEPRVFTALPAAAGRWISALNIEAPAPPPLHPLCRDTNVAEGAARILRPKPNAVFFITPGLPRDKQEIPLEAAGTAARELYWFVDGRFMTSASPTQQVWLPPTPGKHEIRLLDASGQGDTIRIEIMAPG